MDGKLEVLVKSCLSGAQRGVDGRVRRCRTAPRRFGARDGRQGATISICRGATLGYCNTVTVALYIFDIP